MNCAPRLSTCSLTAGLVSNASTLAPSLRAVAIACNPATPAPTISTLAGGIVPAAVIKRGKNLPRYCAAINTARYPAILAIELRASMLCERDIRGINSMAKLVIDFLFMRSRNLESKTEERNPM